MIRPTRVIEREMDKVSHMLMCCHKDEQISRLMKLGIKLRLELSQAKKEPAENGTHTSRS